MAKFIIPIPTTLSGLKVIFVLFLVVVAIVILLVSIKYCCLKCVCNCDDEEKQEAPAQLESVHSVQHGFDKSSNIPPPPYPPQLQPVNNPEQVTRFGSRC